MTSHTGQALYLKNMVDLKLVAEFLGHFRAQALPLAKQAGMFFVKTAGKMIDGAAAPVRALAAWKSRKGPRDFGPGIGDVSPVHHGGGGQHGH